MKAGMGGILFAARAAGAAAVLLLASAGALSQGSASPAAADGTQARSALGLQIEHASISVANFQAEADWYVRNLGFSQPAGAEGVQTMMGGKMKAGKLFIPGFRLDLIQYEGSERPKPPSPVFMQQGFIHLAFTTVDLDAAFAFLQAAGTDVKANRNKQGKVTQMLLHDPEGNELEIFPR
jgi:catechol 2,3-dioxygenase-like lactoylglutathione lyase family enzyme